MSTIWGKTGFRPVFYDNLVFGTAYPKEEIENDFDGVPNNMKERLFVAKCHALKAYRTAAAALVVEYRRDADLHNQANSYDANPREEFKLLSPELPYAEYPHEVSDRWVYHMVDRLPDYFPSVKYGGSQQHQFTTTPIQCPCSVVEGIGHTWKSGLPGYTDSMYKDDRCSKVLSSFRLRDLMCHFHSKDTPVHSAFFAYLAFMSGDRIPDFGYSFIEHNLLAFIPDNAYHGVLVEQRNLSSHQSDYSSYGSGLDENSNSKSNTVLAKEKRNPYKRAKVSYCSATERQPAVSSTEDSEDQSTSRPAYSTPQKSKERSITDFL